MKKFNFDSLESIKKTLQDTTKSIDDVGDNIKKLQKIMESDNSKAIKELKNKLQSSDKDFKSYKDKYDNVVKKIDTFVSEQKHKVLSEHRSGTVYADEEVLETFLKNHATIYFIPATLKSGFEKVNDQKEHIRQIDYNNMVLYHNAVIELANFLISEAKIWENRYTHETQSFIDNDGNYLGVNLSNYVTGAISSFLIGVKDGFIELLSFVWKIASSIVVLVATDLVYLVVNCISFVFPDIREQGWFISIVSFTKSKNLEVGNAIVGLKELFKLETWSKIATSGWNNFQKNPAGFIGGLIPQAILIIGSDGTGAASIATDVAATSEKTSSVINVLKSVPKVLKKMEKINDKVGKYTNISKFFEETYFPKAVGISEKSAEENQILGKLKKLADKSTEKQNMARLVKRGAEIYKYNKNLPKNFPKIKYYQDKEIQKQLFKEGQKIVEENEKERKKIEESE